MTKERRFCLCAASVLLTGTVGSFVSVPVFANGPVDISIVELVEDGSGGYKYWEDITDAMPGMTYSAIPRVRNDGSVPVFVQMCLSESAVDGDGGVINLLSNTFEIDVNGGWSLNTGGSGNVMDPASGNCYDYATKLGVGDVTEPLFTSVTLSREIDNEHSGSTFRLHLIASAWENEDTEPVVVPDDSGDGAGSVTNDVAAPGSPDTGLNTASYLDIVSPLLYSSAAIVLLAGITYGVRKLLRK